MEYHSPAAKRGSNPPRKTKRPTTRSPPRDPKRTIRERNLSGRNRLTGRAHNTGARTSHPCRIRLRQLAAVPDRLALQRLQGVRFIEVNEGVELLGQPGLEVVAPALGLGAVDDADCAFEARCAEQGGGVVLRAQIEPELREPDCVEERFV